jgi:hypothetical protein
MERLLEQIKTYIEYTEETISCQFGTGVLLSELIKNNRMPKVYDDVLFELSKF